MAERLNIAIVGLGNCASSLVQGIFYYRGGRAAGAIGLLHPQISGYAPGDIELAAAFAGVEVEAECVGVEPGAVGEDAVLLEQRMDVPVVPLLVTIGPRQPVAFEPLPEALHGWAEEFLQVVAHLVNLPRL